MPPNAALLAEDETILKLFPPLRAAWAQSGAQARVAISGYNAQAVLFCALNLRTGCRTLLCCPKARAGDFQQFLIHLRRSYRGRPVWLLLDEASCHTAKGTRTLAAELGIKLVWLPHQCPELNPMDQLWKELKTNIAANRQFASIDQTVSHAEQWMLALSPPQTLRKAGMCSPTFWLHHFSTNFCPLT